MKFALIDNSKTEATRRSKGICPSCGAELIAKCGESRTHHWAHKGDRNCDPWWENETKWHRSWKSNFDPEWQEVPMYDQQTDEKHIADIRTSYGLVIEFQHSHIDPQERTTRENFYRKMVWVVDGTRRKNDFKRFLKATGNFCRTNNKGIYLLSFREECFPFCWLKSSALVIFDFRGLDLIDDPKDLRNSIYCLYPKQVAGQSILISMTHDFFVSNIINGDWLTLMKNVSQFQITLQRQTELRRRQQENMMFEQFSRAVRRRRRRF